MDMILIFGFFFLAGLVQGATDGRNIFGSFRPTSSAPNLTPELQNALINGGHRGLGDGPITGLMAPRDHCLAALLMASDKVRGDCGVIQ